MYAIPEVRSCRYACVTFGVCAARGEKKFPFLSLNGFSAAGRQFDFETRIYISTRAYYNADRASVCFLKPSNQLIFGPRRRSRLVIIIIECFAGERKSSLAERDFRLLSVAPPKRLIDYTYISHRSFSRQMN
jgi:hypothetical protein